MRINKDYLLQRLRKRKPIKRSSDTAWSFLASPWFIIFWPIFSFLLLDSLSVINNFKGVYSEWQLVKPRIYETNDWSGIWQTIPEGYADAKDLGIDWGVPNDPILEIVAEGTEFGGSIHTKGLCWFPFWGTAQLRGQLPLIGSSTKATVWEIIGGKKTDIAVIGLTRNGIEMDVKFLSGPEEIFYSSSKLWLAPGLKPYEDIQVAKRDEGWCKAQQRELNKDLDSIINKP